MSSTPQIGERERDILTAIVETYIETGEPVGSRTLSRQNKEGLSSASIRNVMADLADSGFLEQPHTSAGRVPTPLALRYYVEQISGRARLSRGDESMINKVLHEVTDAQEFLERTSRVLSLISHGVGVTVAASGPRNALEHVYFSRLGDRKVLAVIVARGGIVHDRVLRMDREIPQADLEFAARYINENFRGWTVEAIRTEIEQRIQRERGEYEQLMQSLRELYEKGALQGSQVMHEVFVEGAANLVVSEEDKEHLRKLLATLEEKEQVAELLAAYLSTPQEAVRVIIGLEDAPAPMRNLVLIGAPARVGGEVMGSLAVLGPPRIDYQHTITAVSYIARMFDRIFNESESSK